MPPSINEQIAQIKCEIEKQDQQWHEAMRKLSELGDTPLAIAPDFFQAFDRLAPQSAPIPTQGIRA